MRRMRRRRRKRRKCSDRIQQPSPDRKGTKPDAAPCASLASLTHKSFGDVIALPPTGCIHRSFKNKLADYRIYLSVSQAHLGSKKPLSILSSVTRSIKANFRSSARKASVYTCLYPNVQHKNVYNIFTFRPSTLLLLHQISPYVMLICQDTVSLG